MRDAFSLVPVYLRDDAASPWFSEFGIHRTRSRFDADAAAALGAAPQRIPLPKERADSLHETNLMRRPDRHARSQSPAKTLGPLSKCPIHLAGTRTGRFDPLQRRIKPRGRSDCHMFEMPIIRAVGTYFSLSELAMMRHSGVMP